MLYVTCQIQKYERKIKSLFMTYVDFKSILVPKGNVE